MEKINEMNEVVKENLLIGATINPDYFTNPIKMEVSIFQPRI
jgi:5-formaminoimidazole-4-carboxamide-1-beta-D-ribofuranosyl 5'-monophosphate synthetase